MELFDPNNIKLTKYLFYTGKGGVGKTSLACATAVRLADLGKKVLLISTDPASNLQDVFSIDLDNKGVLIPDVPNLIVLNLDPIKAANEYKESVIAPYKNKLPDSVIKNMEEQLSGSCTIEIAAFNEFSKFITDENIKDSYDHIIFDTAPTGHTLRMLQLPSAWSNFISESTHGASCLGQLSGLEDKKLIYKHAVETLSNANSTTLILVTRPETSPLNEAQRAYKELSVIGVTNQILVVNGILTAHNDSLSLSIYNKQQSALSLMPESLKSLKIYSVPLRAYNVIGIDNIRTFFNNDYIKLNTESINIKDTFSLNHIINDLSKNDKRVIFTMGKGGVGKTTVAAAVALGLSKLGKKVHLTTTDPAAHLKFIIDESSGITMSHINENEELKKYQNEVLTNARKAGMTEDDLAYIEEDLRSPCTQEIAIFRAFAQIVDKADDEVIVIDTAPTGHTLLLLESTQNYNQEIKRTKGEVPKSVEKLLPRLKSSETEVLIVTIPEATPVYEALRLEDDLKRAGIFTKWWIINQSFYATNTKNDILAAKAQNEVKWINQIDKHTKSKFALISWTQEEIKGENLLKL